MDAEAAGVAVTSEARGDAVASRFRGADTGAVAGYGQKNTQRARMQAEEAAGQSVALPDNDLRGHCYQTSLTGARLSRGRRRRAPWGQDARHTPQPKQFRGSQTTAPSVGTQRRAPN